MSTKVQEQREIYIRLVNKSEDYIEGHLDETIFLKNLANHANLSEFHFHRIFKKYANETLKNFITRFKLERAAMYMQINSSQSLTTIALKYGYNDSSSFSKAFKRQFGCSPSVYRKEQERTRTVYNNLS